MAKGKRRHYTPAELCQMARKVELEKQLSLRSTYSMTLTFVCYALYTNEKWGQKRMARFLEIMQDEFAKIDESETYMKEKQEELQKRYGWTVKYIQYSESDMPTDMKKGSFVYHLQYQNLCNTNTLYEVMTKVCVASFTALMQLGMSNPKLSKLRDDVVAYWESGDITISQRQHEILEEELGLYIERGKYYSHTDGREVDYGEKTDN